ncbi:hypothetical protein [Stenotrophomonas sp.]|uniref:hypothetical protein n=1 Tax=Stenotrophomonas sp. TaxID=69392 RepID=UPI00289996BD|nr:hypothetical protein [Stenotrophomonas sp.]
MLKLATGCLLLCAATFGAADYAHAQARAERVQFAKGASAKTISDSLKGDQSVDHVVGARGGQQLTVALDSSNTSTYFNVLPPGSETALFVGSTSGNQFTGTLPASGDYRVRVYLMRNVARRNESTDYKLRIGVTGGAATATTIQPSAKGKPISAGNRPAYCRGEAAGQYGTRPAYIKTLAPMKAASGAIIIDGTVDKGSEGIKKFRCRFDAQGLFIDVMALTPDGE